MLCNDYFEYIPDNIDNWYGETTTSAVIKTIIATIIITIIAMIIIIIITTIPIIISTASYYNTMRIMLIMTVWYYDNDHHNHDDHSKHDKHDKHYADSHCCWCISEKNNKSNILYI